MRTAFLFTTLGIAALSLLCSAPHKVQAFDYQAYGGPSGRVGSISTTPTPAANPAPPITYVVVVYPMYRPAAPAPVVVGAYDNSFTPRTMFVPVGATVVWTNNGRHTHTITGDDKNWDSGDLAPGASYAAMFTRPGTFHYHCLHHKGMKGTIVVGSGSGSGY